jgi:hypothetical protein
MAILKNTTVNDTSSLTIPAGSTAQRTIVSFTTVGSTTWTAPIGVTKIKVLVVAGGGGGGWGANNADGNGGGGAGGVVYNSAYTVIPGNAYTVTVGAGGATPASAGANQRGSGGGNSVFDTITATGGGGGGSDTTNAGLNGGSGGGAGCSGTGGTGGSGTANQGNNGGNAAGGAGPGGGGGGGGGAGAVGGFGLGTYSKGGDGGQGALYAISGVPSWYGGGGGGSSWQSIGGFGGAGGGGNGASRTASPYVSYPATPNTGGGGGAGTATYIGSAGASGVVIINYSIETVEVFSKPGSTTWTAPANVSSVEVLVVAGGGGASGADYATGGGGGGAGGVLYNSAYTVTPGNSYSVVVGTGGASVTGTTAGNSGGNSTFDTITATGGGRGAGYSGNAAGTGGSGGGGTWTQNAGAAGTAGQGFAGGAATDGNRTGGGGGGAGGVGNAGSNTQAGQGGPGVLYSITGYPTYYGGGGGGGSADWTDPPTLSGRKPGAGGVGGGGGGAQAIGSGGNSAAGYNGAPGTGGGAGGSSFNVSSANAAAIYSASGGSGVVILRYNTVSGTGSANRGLVRYNTTTSNFELYNGTRGWVTQTASHEIIGKGLIAHWDAGHPRSKVFYPQKLLDDNVWDTGNNSIGTFNLNGTTSANQRLLDYDPWGRKNIIWEARAQATNTGEGGWNSNNFTVDPAKPHRFTQWMRRTVIGTGTTYFGTNNVNNCSDLTANGNPYFYALGWPVQINQWFLWVAHCYPNSTTSGGTNPAPVSGLYTVEGGADYKMYGGQTDYVLSGTSINQRTYLYYTTTTDGRQQFYRPRVDPLDGTEPSLQSLLNDDPVDPYIWYDIKGTYHMIMVNNNITYDPLDKSLVYNGTNSYTQTNFAYTFDFRTGGTFECWYFLNSISSGQGFLSISPSPSYLNLYMASNGLMRWEVIGTTGSAYSDLNSNTVHVPGRWYHAIGTWDTNNTYLYINGVLEASQTNYTNSPFNITAQVTTGSYAGYLNGKMSICRIYNRPLTAQEVAQNFNAERGRHGI